MAKAIYIPDAENPQKRPLFDRISATFIEQYADLMARVREATGQEDEQALQATTYTIWRLTNEEMNRVSNLINFPYSGDASVDFDIFSAVVKKYPEKSRQAFIDLFMLYHGDNIGEKWVREKVESVPTNKFYFIADYLALVEQLVARWNYETGILDFDTYQRIREELTQRQFPDGWVGAQETEE